MVSGLRIARLDASHKRDNFICGSEPLERYIKTQATQDMRKRVSSCFVALTAENEIAGYYTLASTSVFLSELPESITKKLPRYPMVPAVLMGRLAVSQTYKGLGVGGVLLYDALHRATIAEIAAYALVVDSKDQSATAFYEHHGFMQLVGVESKLFIPLLKAVNT